MGNDTCKGKIAYICIFVDPISGTRTTRTSCCCNRQIVFERLQDVTYEQRQPIQKSARPQVFTDYLIYKIQESLKFPHCISPFLHRKYQSKEFFVSSHSKLILKTLNGGVCFLEVLIALFVGANAYVLI